MQQVSSMEEIARVLDTWSVLGNNMRVRDRGIKIMQYGCQMLLGFYSSKLTEEVNEGLKVGRRTASTSRKAFWLLKSISHINSCLVLAGEIMQEFTWAKLLDLVEQLFLVIYYFTENIVYFIRVKWLATDEDDIDPYVNWSWFAGDLACFLSALVRFCYSVIQCNQNTAPNDPRTIAKFKQLYMDILSLSIVSSFPIDLTNFAEFFCVLFRRCLKSLSQQTIFMASRQSLVQH